MTTYLITGANRGLGLEFVRQLAARGDTVHACCRAPEAAGELGEIASAHPEKVALHRLEVTDPAQIDAVAAALADTPIDVLILNAGIWGGPRQTVDDVDFDAWRQVMEVNVYGAMRVLQAMIPHLEAGARGLAVAISSGMGSIGDNTSGSWYAYRSSKAALNMMVKCAAIDLAPRGVAPIAMNPGWVQTDMGGPSANLRPAQSIAGMLKVIDGLERGDAGTFRNYDGGTYVW